jgi:GNAT superfamily N-acetyltransferase
MIFSAKNRAGNVPFMVTVTEATLDRIPDLVSSVDGLFAEDAGRHDPGMDLDWPRREGVAYYAGLLGNETALCLLADSGGPAGHLIGRITSSDLRPGGVTAVLESLRVAPAFRRAGVGSALLAEFLAWARRKHANRLKVTAFAANDAAIAFYRRHGFEPFELTLSRPMGRNPALAKL